MAKKRKTAKEKVATVRRSSRKSKESIGEPENKKNREPKKDLKLKQVKIKIKKKYSEKQYSEESLKKALAAVDNGLTLRKAATLFGVPKSTLHAKINYHVPIDCVKGAPTILSANEECDIVDWILYSAERGFPVTKSYLLDCVQQFVTSEKRETPFKDNRPGKHWYNGFMKRHPNLSKRLAQNLTSSRASVTEQDLKKWFSIVKNYLQEKDLLNVECERIFNLDESAFMLVPKDNTVITRKGAKSVYQIVGGNEKACLTVLFTAAASGQLAPPMVLFDLKTIPKKNVVNSIPKGWGIGHSDRGWMTSETFYSYIVNVFYKWLLENKYKFPIILYVDGHASHLSLPLMKFCKEVEIELIALYPNATHMIQPLDVALFHPLKEVYKNTLRTWRIDNNVVDVKKHMFSGILKQALDSIDLTETIKNGFRACGLCPFDSSAVNYDILNKKKKKSNTSSSPDNSTLENVSSTSNNPHLLHLFETSVLGPKILEEFINYESQDLWEGEESQKGLFEYWKELKRLCGT